MTPTRPSAFLQSKITQAGTAIFQDMGDSLYKITTTVVQVLKMEEDAVWFVIPRPAFHKNTLNPIFPVQMDFRRKGLDYRIQVTGLGQWVDDEATIDNLISNTQLATQFSTEELLAVRVKMRSADYTKAPKQRINGWWQQIQQSVEALWQPQAQHRVFQF